jgi:catechol 2,3-dioxygenase-like lactoylglutathione lyase family enzyme
MEPTDFKLTRVSVVMLGVSDVKRSLGFYRDKLGLEVQREIPGFAFVNAGATTLCLSEPAAKVRGQVVGAGEIVFSVEDVTSAYQALRGKGVEFTHEPRNVAPDTWVANFDDPDGNHLSLYGPQSKSH